MAYRRPESVLVVVHTPDKVLLLHRQKPFAFWQSVTGSLRTSEDHAAAAARELAEETGLTGEGRLEFTGVNRTFTIDPRWRCRYSPGVTENREFEYRYRLAEPLEIAMSPREHSDYVWLPLDDAIDRVWSWTNREALESLVS